MENWGSTKVSLWGWIGEECDLGFEWMGDEFESG